MKSMLITMLVLAALLPGCSSAEKQAAELLETARFEEKQSNIEHATKLYKEILQKYPSSPAAQEATARMADLARTKP
ncbi:MAG: hypothetical protein IPQ16_01330 [Geobacteraceae bacterium]|nr:hypothetical protein [Geobacteraceae bacterium]